MTWFQTSNLTESNKIAVACHCGAKGGGIRIFGVLVLAIFLVGFSVFHCGLQFFHAESNITGQSKTVFVEKQFYSLFSS